MTKKKEVLQRGAGILQPISSMPSPYGIGTLGKASYDFVDLLEEAGQKYWQVLPVSPTSFGDSPYQSFSAFAGNPYFIDLDYLIEEGLIEKEDVTNYDWGDSESYIDYAKIFENRFKVLHKAFNNSNHKDLKEYKDFCNENNYWLFDYSFYMALKFHFENNEWLLWDEDIRFRKQDAIEKYKNLLGEEIDFWSFCQFKFNEQWKKIKKYANEKGIKIIGDIPLYVALDSADVWVHGDLFELDERKKPINIAGVPPDAFSADGQRWGNPLYDWDKMEKDNFDWWRNRMSSNAKLYDVIRIDHFIGIVNFYSISAECLTAKEGEWRKGPGKKLTDAINKSIGSSNIIAEDLGILTQPVKDLIKSTGYPGMKIIQFAFDGGSSNEYLPHNYVTDNIVAYCGTHDNETLVGFLDNQSKENIEFICKYLNVNKKSDIPNEIIRVLYASPARIIIVQTQDLLLLDNSARMNTPSTVGTNWKWRITKEQYDNIDIDKLKDYTILYGR